MKKVQSTNIDSIHYIPEAKTLEVHFKNGKVYNYSGVSQQSYNEFENAKSLGKHLHSIIHPLHKHTKKV